MLVFVYGTLKQKYGNNYILAGATKVREDRVRGYKLLDSGFPVARLAENSIITGEIYDIGDPATSDQARTILGRLDRLEGYRQDNPESSMYTREVIRTEHDIECNMYVGNPKGFQRNEDWPCEEVGDLKIYTWSR